MSKKMELGLCLFEPRTETGEVSPWALMETCETAEAMGFDYLALPDRVSRPVPRFDTLTLMAGIALRTKKIRMQTHIFVLPLRQPIELARRIITVDHLSQGRFTFVVGLGGEGSSVYLKEYQDVGIAKEERGRRANEMLEALKILWTQPSATFEGKYYRFKDVVFEPKPYQRPHPPIWVGGASEGAFRRVVKYADGWAGSVEHSTVSYGSAGNAIKRLNAMAAEAGRDPQSVHISLCTRVNINKSRDQAVKEAEDFWAKQRGSIEGGRSFDKKTEVGFYGPPELVIDHLKELRNFGVQGIIIHFHSFNIKEQLRRFEQQVMPAMN